MIDRRYVTKPGKKTQRNEKNEAGEDCRKSNSRAVKETALVKDGKNFKGYFSQPFCSNGNKLYSSNFL